VAEPAPIGGSLGRLSDMIRDRGGFTDPAPTEVLPWETGRRSARWAQICPPVFAAATVDDLDDMLRPAVDGWVTDPAGNLLFLGALGVGKTHAALAAARARWDRGDDVTFWPTVELFDALRPDGGATVADLTGVDLLILDDLGVEKPSDWTSERLYAVVNRRWMNRLPIIATSNLEPAGLAGVLGGRTWSRLIGGDTVVLGVGGIDRRRR